MPAVTGRYRGISADDRRAERRERLLDAAFELLGTSGWSQTTVRGVCEAAGLNPRYFYESFEDLDALLLAVFDRMMARTTALVLAAFDEAPDDIERKTRAVLEAFIGDITEDPRRARVLLVEALGSEALARRRLDAMHGMASLVAYYAREFHGAPDDRDPVAEVAATLLVGGMAELTIAWLDGRISLTREALVDDLTALWVHTGSGAVDIARRRERS